MLSVVVRHVNMLWLYAHNLAHILGDHTRVVCSTFDSRGKSLTPESSMFIDESSNCMLVRREETHPSNGAAMARIVIKL